jgi:hypothetical protein
VTDEHPGPLSYDDALRERKLWTTTRSSSGTTLDPCAKASSTLDGSSAAADELATAYNAVTKIDLVTSEQLAPPVAESGIALRRHERAVHPDHSQAYGTLEEILRRMDTGL